MHSISKLLWHSPEHWWKCKNRECMINSLHLQTISNDQHAACPCWLFIQRHEITTSPDDIQSCKSVMHHWHQSSSSRSTSLSELPGELTKETTTTLHTFLSTIYWPPCSHKIKNQTKKTMKIRDKFVAGWLILLFAVSWALSLANLFGVRFWDRRYALERSREPAEDGTIFQGLQEIGKGYYSYRYVWLLPRKFHIYTTKVLVLLSNWTFLQVWSHIVAFCYLFVLFKKLIFILQMWLVPFYGGIFISFNSSRKLGIGNKSPSIVTLEGFCWSYC